MTKEIFKEFLTNEINTKTALLSTNSLTDEDKTAIQQQIDGLVSMVAKVDELEDDVNTAEIVDELKTALNEMGERLTALNEKIQQKNNENETEAEMNIEYLQTRNSVRDFAAAIRNAKTAEEFRTNWNEYLTQNDVNPDSITIEEGSEEAYLPTAIKGMIQDIFDRNADWLKDLNYTGAKRFYVRVNTSDPTDETARAKGWKKGGTKARQDLTLASKLLEGGFIYKLAELDAKTLFDSDDTLIEYVIGELTAQILTEVKRCILASDGRQANDPYKISSFESIGAKTTTDAFTTVTTATSDFLIDDVREMVDGIHNPDNKPVYVFMSKADLRTLARVQASETSTPVFMKTEDVASQISADRIITTDLLPDGVKCVCFIPQEYYMVGAPNLLNPILYHFHEGYKNLDVYRSETVAGGGLNALNSSAVLLAESSNNGGGDNEQ